MNCDNLFNILLSICGDINLTWCCVSKENAEEGFK